MAAPTQIFVAGMNAARIYALSGDYPTGGTATPYDGLVVGGPVSLELTFGDPTTIIHPGNNIVLQQDVFPTADPTTGVLTVSRLDHATLAFLMNTKAPAIGNLSMIGWGTDQQGNEPTVALLAYQQAKTPSGDRAWHTYVIPRCVIIPKPSSLMNRDRSDMVYNVSVQNSTQHLTGVDFSVSVDGYTSGQMVDIQSYHRVHFAQFTSVSNATVFTFDTLLPAYADAVAKVSINGAAYCTEGAGADVQHAVSTKTNVTIGAATTTGDKVVVMYELDDTISDLSG
jgi:hypothetical protein